jgi:hypothetical protein
MGNVSIHGGHAPCRGCGESARRPPPVQRMVAGRAFESAGGEGAESTEAVPVPGFGHDFANMAVSHGGGDEDG